MTTTPPEVQAILEKQKLTEIKNVSSHFHNYTSICQNKKGQKIYIKVRLYPDIVPRENFIKEVILNKFLSDNFYLNRYFTTPKYYASDTKNRPEWLTREYISGTRMGDTWGFGREFYQKVPVKEIADMLDFIRSDVSPKFFLKSKVKDKKLFKRHGGKEYVKYFIEFLPSAKKFIKYGEQKKSLGILRKYGKFFTENNCLAHGDMHPGNVVYNRRKIIVHDWKYARWDNPYLDFTFLWFLAWTNKIWRKKLFQIELGRAKDKNLFLTLFYLSVLKLTPKMISIFTQSTNRSEKDFKNGISEILSAFHNALYYFSDI